MVKHAIDCLKLKEKGHKLTMVTCYDYTFACLVEKTEIDMVLVGDSAAMVMHGYPDTTHATVTMMQAHTAAVARGIKTKLVVGDLPFLSYRKTLSKSMDAVQALVQAGAGAVKLEGAKGNLDLISHIVHSGIPVMGHIGLTPQSVLGLGGFKVQGKKAGQQQTLIAEAKALEDAGCFAIVLECIPHTLAQTITEKLKIPTIGIGAGPNTDGQVLVLQDMLGLQGGFKPKFLKHYCQGEPLFIESLNQFVREVQIAHYPALEHVYESH